MHVYMPWEGPIWVVTTNSVSPDFVGFNPNISWIPSRYAGNFWEFWWSSLVWIWILTSHATGGWGPPGLVDTWWSDGTPPFIAAMKFGHLEGELPPRFRGLTITMVIKHILQVRRGWSSKWQWIFFTCWALLFGWQWISLCSSSWLQPSEKDVPPWTLT